MTILETANNIETRMKALKETVGGVQVPIFDTVIVGGIDPQNLPKGTSITIRAVVQGDALNFSGPNPPYTPFATPWHLTVYRTGRISEATKEIYRIIPLVLAELNTDMSFGGACSEAYWPEPYVIYDEDFTSKTNMIGGARIVFIALYQ
jgi:hypothetical protein